MSLSLTKLGDIALTIIIALLTLSPLCLLLLVRLGGYRVNLCAFYSNWLIGKLTAFLQLQEFSLHNRPVDCSTSAARRSPHVKSKLGSILTKAAALRINLNLDGAPIVSKSHTHPSHSQTSINLVSIFRCSSPPSNPVYARRVDPSALVFSLSSHRHSYTGLLFSSRFIIHKKQK
jgi:hypothetical protein